MIVDIPHDRADAPNLLRGLLQAAHLGPALAVTVLSGLLSLAQGLSAGRAALVVAAVLCGQLCVGWSNDLIDRRRDLLAGRADKPLARGAVPVPLARACCAAAVIGCVVLSLSAGIVAGLIHLACVAAAWAYNLGLKSTLFSWAPYAVAFGGLTAFVALAGGQAPPWWWPVSGALLGVGAHLLNVLPDLADDAATGVRGLPHVLGARRLTVLAGLVLLAASAVVLAGARPPVVVTVLAAVVVVVLAATAVSGSGRRPFTAAVGIALIDAVLLVSVR